MQKTQIAVSCITPLSVGEITKDVAVVSLIGIAFDSKKQVDQILYRDEYGNLDENALMNAMIQSYYFAFNAVLWYVKNGQPSRRVLCVSAIGNTAFRPHEYSTPEFTNNFVTPAVEHAYDIFMSIHKNTNIAYIIMDEAFRVPNSILNRPQLELDQYVYVNAWDAHSMLGNGNANDESLDGYWGRSSAISLLGWPMSNPYISYVGCNLT